MSGLDEFWTPDAEKTYGDAERECPYCHHTYQPESEDFHDDRREETCDKCGKKFYSHDNVTVCHVAVPDCELNGEQHNYQPAALPGGRTHPFCTKCGKCQ